MTNVTLDTPQGLGQGLKTQLYDYTFSAKATTGKTGGITLTLSQFDKIINARVSGTVAGYVAEPSTISDNTVKLKLWKQDGTTGALKVASTAAIASGTVVYLTVTGYKV